MNNDFWPVKLKSGPTTYVKTHTTCDGCQFFKRTMKRRSVRSSSTGPVNEDYFYCTNPDTPPPPNPFDKVPANTQGKLELEQRERYIGEGTSAGQRTPQWCPLIKREAKNGGV